MKRLLQLLNLLTIAFLFVALSCNTQKVELHKFEGSTMGTYYRVAVVHAQAQDLQEMKAYIEAKLAHVNQLMSTYIENSQISLFNKSNSLDGFSIHPDFVYVLEQAKEIHHRSQKHFDVTVMPLVNLWGFGPQNKKQIPSQKVIDETLEFVGSDKYSVNLKSNQVTKHHPKLQIDLSAIAKGYGVDAVFEGLQEKFNLENLMVEIGGEVRASKQKLSNKKWIIGIESPNEDGTRSIQKAVALSDLAMATSGSYRNYFKSGGKKFSHTIDLSSGKPITHKLISASVIATNTLIADAWATAFMAMGEQKAMLLANKLKMKTYFLIKKEDGVKEYISPEMKEYLEKFEVHP